MSRVQRMWLCTMVVLVGGACGHAQDPPPVPTRRGPSDEQITRAYAETLAREARCIVECASCEVRVMPVDFIRDEDGLRMLEPKHIETMPLVEDATFHRRYYAVVIPERRLGAATVCEEPHDECRENWDQDAAVRACYERPDPDRSTCLEDVQKRTHWWRCSSGVALTPADAGMFPVTDPTGPELQDEFTSQYRPRSRRKTSWLTLSPTQ